MNKSKLWEYKDKIISDYNSGKTIMALGLEYMRSPTAVMNFLKKNGVAMRNKGRRKKLDRNQLIEILKNKTAENEATTIKELSEKFGVTQSYMRLILLSLPSEIKTCLKIRHSPFWRRGEGDEKKEALSI